MEPHSPITTEETQTPTETQQVHVRVAKPKEARRTHLYADGRELPPGRRGVGSGLLGGEGPLDAPQGVMLLGVVVGRAGGGRGVAGGGHGRRGAAVALGQAAGPRAVEAVRRVAAARLAVGLALAVLAVQVGVLRRLGAALHRHRDVGLGGGAGGHGGRGRLLTGGDAGGDYGERREGDRTVSRQNRAGSVQASTAIQRSSTFK